MNKNNSPEALGKQILNLARSQLLVNFRFLDRSLVELKTKESNDVSFLSDGNTLYYDPWFILTLYKKDQNSINHNYLHLILHLIFRHSNVRKDINKSIYNLACDIFVEKIIKDLDKEFLKTKNQILQESFLDKINELNKDNKNLNVTNIYKIIESLSLSEQEIDEISSFFWGDSHSLWFDDNNTRYSKDIDVAINWEEISKRMQIELELIDDDKGLLVRQLRNVNRIKKDYDEFLRKFTVNNETLKISEDEFDNNYYSYGLSLYGNMPIIEPLEYSDTNKLEDFVIVLDTSGSIKKEVCEKFIDHTYKMLNDSNLLSDNFNIHIIQCDDRVREDALIKNKKEMENYLNNIVIKGLGETDFRPVFEYIDNKIRNNEIKNLKGLLYFTDGEGIFPSKIEEYKVAFIIHQDGMYESVKVPSWCMKFELDDEDILSDRLSY